MPTTDLIIVYNRRGRNWTKVLGAIQEMNSQLVPCSVADRALTLTFRAGTPVSAGGSPGTPGQSAGPGLAPRP